MKTILLLGAGRSSVYLIDYFLDNAPKENWTLTIADITLEGAKQKIGNRPNAKAIQLDATHLESLQTAISECDIVVSMLPPALHANAARLCVRFNKHLATASYLSNEIKGLGEDAKTKGIILLSECGLDPGIDHLSARQKIDQIRSEGGKLISFKSYCGGLVAPANIDNPFGYKFSWNPRNVILAGQATASYLEKGKQKFIPYNRIFSEIETIQTPNGETFDAYANRDSLSYLDIYEIQEVQTMLRGTLRYPDFCRLWNFFVRAGFTDANCELDTSTLTYKQLLESYRPKAGLFFPELSLAENNEIESLISSSGLFDDVQIGLQKGSPADILQELLERRWRLAAKDKDRVVMQHIFQYEVNNELNKITSTLDILGKNEIHTAMAKTVGLPLAIATKLILQGKIKQRGAVIPVTSEFYNPILQELESLGIRFVETIN